ncbi:U3 small nucleolar RNA-associated protein NOL7 [Tiliqua scincoides]|uniref:U3 small nucleolar RNA-associated protein NOL7 n=1 Tax=Tiliqua scincoides TaxID=71010 RepID=UPI003461B117
MVARRDGVRRGRRETVGAAAAAFSSEEESDGAPEEVTFESARAAAEETRRLAGERARREKAILKEKRRRREELFKEQKKRKLLPENILEELASSVQNNKNQPSNRPVQGQNVEDKSESEIEEHANEDNEEELLATRLQESYMAVRLKDQDFITRQQQTAKDFVQRHLYGAGSNRTTANNYFSVENKRSAVKKAAVQFVNRSWGSTRKQKARQFTKQWMSSKRVTT